MDIEAADTASWNIAESKVNGQPSIIRYRPDLHFVLGDKNYPKNLTIFWDYEYSDSSGMPSNTLSEEMRQFEDAIVPILDIDRLAIFVFTYTVNGTREWHFYTNDINAVGEKINSALSNLPKFPIKMQVETDADWTKLREVYELCR
ncbi:DUF695 domain-containing protein [Alteromonas sp. 1_MG-2023]|uniref:DUF695 domain-containing protein n=1 Tax=Alteromonas sp. 1_MG-2023 TaxID=3062669 RepID=UPI0026E4584C|nr:DUF695 domain-containing protein [Alteromonas sp. 1_MG-2023]MDO6567724.1 DUF695 domain-containing protein [Alteromonas sp. 1_MG-2023]